MDVPQLTNDGLRFLSGLHQLEQIAINSKNVDEEFLDFISASRNLVHIDVKNTSVDYSATLRFLMSEKKLSLRESFEILGIQVSGYIIQLNGDKITDDVLEVVSQSNSDDAVVQLEIDSPSVTEDGWRHLTSLKSLWRLSVVLHSGQSIPWKDYSHLPLSHVAIKTADSSTAVLKGIESCQALIDLSIHAPIDDQSLRVIAQLPQLSFLHLRDPNISDAGWSVLGTLPSLEVLDLTNNANQLEVRTTTNFPALRMLTFSEINVVVESLPALQHLPALETVNFFNCNITKQEADRLKNTLTGPTVWWGTQ